LGTVVKKDQDFTVAGKHASFLTNLSREVDNVWNYCNELQITMFNRERRFLSGFDFAKFTRGATKEGLHLHRIAGLEIRARTCGQCETVHDRDVNAAKNILAAGRRGLAEGIPVR
jgi:hypothetical protein